MTISSLLNVMGFLLTSSAAIILLEPVAVWKGEFREEISLIASGFAVLAIGFMWQIFVDMGLIYQFGNFLMVLGTLPLVIGSSRLFRFTTIEKGADAAHA